MTQAVTWIASLPATAPLKDFALLMKRALEEEGWDLMALFLMIDESTPNMERGIFHILHHHRHLLPLLLQRKRVARRCKFRKRFPSKMRRLSSRIQVHYRSRAGLSNASIAWNRQKISSSVKKTPNTWSAQTAASCSPSDLSLTRTASVAIDPSATSITKTNATRTVPSKIQ